MVYSPYEVPLLKNNDILLLVKNRNLYFLSWATHCDCVSVYRSQKPRFLRLAAWMVKHNLPFKGWLLGSWKHELKRYKQVIFLDFGFEPFMASYVRKHFDHQMILFFWNVMDHDRYALIQHLSALQTIDDFYTFSSHDARQYGLRYNSTFYVKSQTVPVPPLEYDVFYGGTNRGREAKILELARAFSALNLRVHLHTTEFETQKNETYVSYTDYLQLTLQSRSILEVMKEHQTGVTLRSMEAIHFKRKLITTNLTITEYKFYHPNNIFVVGIDDIHDLPEFLDRPWIDIPQSVLDFYHIGNWLKRFDPAYPPALISELEFNEDIKTQTE